MDRRRVSWQKLFIYFVIISFIFTIIVSYIAIVDKSQLENLNKFIDKRKSDYILIIIQCILGIVIMTIPKILKYKFNITASSNLLVFLSIFLYCAIYLGEAKNFYYTISYWDTILHTLSGFALSAVGFLFLDFLMKNELISVKINPLFMVFFSFCFSVSLGVIWEIYEFVFDGLLNLNMQKFSLENGYQLVGRAALIDTMKDLVMDCIGAIIMCLLGYISLKYEKNWIEKFFLK